MFDVVGVTHVRGCCRFVWVERGQPSQRLVLAPSYHCSACLEELARMAKLQQIKVASPRMDHVRILLGERRDELIDRWQRQLRATAEAGFALDPATADVLPVLLGAAERALERKFRPAAGGESEASHAARKAAMQSSLLGDFIFDAVLESLPDLSVAEQRVLSDALAHAAVEVLVKRAHEGGGRDVQRVSRLAHELRDSMTAAQLAYDLLLPKLPDTRAASALGASLRKLREGLEDAALDEILSAGGLRKARVRVGPLLADCASSAKELGAAAKQLHVRAAPTKLSVRGDPRVVAPAVRGLLRAAIDVAQPGSVIRFDAAAQDARTRILIEVARCRKGPAGRLGALPQLAIVRRAARAQGGSVAAEKIAQAGCIFTLALPAATRG